MAILITDFDVISHGFHNPDRFPGCDTGRYLHCVTSSGDSEREAFDTALEEIKNMDLGDLDLTKVEKEGNDLSETYYDAPLEYEGDDEDEGGFFEEEAEEKVFYFTIRFNLTPKKKK